jgi:hypothetical protein
LALLLLGEAALSSDLKPSRLNVQIDLVDKVTSQILTLSSAIIAVLVTVLGYYFKYSPENPIPYIGMLAIFLAGVFFLGSIIFGIFVYGALIASLQPKTEDAEGDDKESKKSDEKPKNAGVYGRKIAICAAIQWVCFLIGIGLLLVSLYQVTMTPPTG